MRFSLGTSRRQAVRERLADVAPHLGQLDAVQPPIWLNGQYFKVNPCRYHRVWQQSRPCGHRLHPLHLVILVCS